ncbi:hypothetical protein LSM04_009273 [Trypanosoma melophagium]|uniref:uncharacterized protein n=1 Tax=Trypanosoma melophagium TaxID=715481 RepID=UPI00351A876A|nr:hypothetical protein LSM04_009273 [Trypanosoma melophagium]
MGLLLDDEEDYTHPLKTKRVESATSANTAITVNTTTTTTTTHNNNNRVGEDHTTAPLEVRRRGGNGIEKMAAFAFGAANTIVKVASIPPTSQQLKQEQEQSAVKTTSAKSLDSFSPSQKQNTEPSTVAKTMFSSSQTFSEATETTPNTQNNPQQTELTIPLSLNSNISSQGNAALTAGSAIPSANSVSRQLFTEGVNTKKEASTVSNTSSSRAITETVSKPKGQMKLSDFFTKMACTRKRE